MVLFVLGITYTQFLYFTHSEHCFFVVLSQLATSSPPTDLSYSALQPPMPMLSMGEHLLKRADLI